MFPMKESRMKKLEGMVNEIIAEIIFEEASDLEDHFGIITITWVKMSQDLSYLDVFVSSFKDINNLPKALAEYNTPIQKKLNKKLPLYKLPKVRFRYDDSGEKAAHINTILKNLEKK